MNNNLIKAIIEIEWEMFTQTQNIGGPASCQQDQVTFRIMRESQFDTFPESVLESYLSDLKNARQEGQNLVTIKYARMMAYTDPVSYLKIKRKLPKLAAGTNQLVNEIVDVFMVWNQDLSKKYPKLIAKGRPLTASNDSPYSTSVETYLRGELKTYSFRTLKLYRDFVLQSKDQGFNLAEATLLNTVKKYGYETLESAEPR